MYPITDMAMELKTGSIRRKTEHTVRTDITLDEKDARRLGKAQGTYITVEADADADNDELVSSLADGLKETSGRADKVLVVGLGNPHLTADMLGNLVTDKIETGERIKALRPSVTGVTGIESFDVVKGVCNVIKPDIVVAVDSLASATVSRIGRAFQICSSGITPGSGVGNHRIRLCYETLGVKVVSIGVPLVVYASTIAEECGGKPDGKLSELIVTPKDIDYLVDRCAEVISKALSKAFVT